MRVSPRLEVREGPAVASRVEQNPRDDAENAEEEEEEDDDDEDDVIPERA